MENVRKVARGTPSTRLVDETSKRVRLRDREPALDDRLGQAVESRQNVLGYVESSDRWLGADIGMRPVPVFAVNEEEELEGALLS